MQRDQEGEYGWRQKREGLQSRCWRGKMIIPFGGSVILRLFSILVQTGGKDANLLFVSTSPPHHHLLQSGGNLQTVAQGSCILSNIWPPRPPGVSQSGFISPTLTDPTPASCAGWTNAALIRDDSFRANVSP